MTAFDLVVQGPAVASPDVEALRALARGRAIERITGGAYRITRADPGAAWPVARHCEAASLDWGFVAEGRRLADFRLLALDMTPRSSRWSASTRSPTSPAASPRSLP